ncbi:MAG: hypothetical protein ABIC91_01920 [Nanoarchaeota archaeon]|nr:hypothetical protein [Nanoarchaeota archaeon]MBU1030641.1 hypothetical protein [Nanoarchaeota archaeon]MBU1849843.1 hypothetical protein [Nanoarchaeota archaeon]
MKTKKVLCFGNPFIPIDSLAIEIGKELKLKGFEFVICVSPQEIIQHTNFSFILDVCENIKKVSLIGIKDLKANTLFTLHDFDLNFFLQLMKSIGRIDEVKIIAIPINYDKQKAKEEIAKILQRKNL